MNKWLVLFIIQIFAGSLLAQKHDYIWKLGYDLFDNPTNGFGISTINFNTYPLEMDFNDSLQFFFYVSSTTYSDFDGNLLFYTNGLDIKMRKTRHSKQVILSMTTTIMICGIHSVCL